MIDPFRLTTRDGGQIDGAELRRLAEAVRRLELMYLAPRAQSITTPGGPVLFTRGLGGGQLQVQVNGDTPRPFEPLWNLLPRNGLVITAVDVPGAQRIDITLSPPACLIPIPTAICLLYAGSSGGGGSSGSGLGLSGLGTSGGSGAVPTGIRVQYQNYDLTTCQFVGAPWCVDNALCCPSAAAAGACCPSNWVPPAALCLAAYAAPFGLYQPNGGSFCGADGLVRLAQATLAWDGTCFSGSGDWAIFDLPGAPPPGSGGFVPSVAASGRYFGKLCCVTLPNGAQTWLFTATNLGDTRCWVSFAVATDFDCSQQADGTFVNRSFGGPVGYPFVGLNSPVLTSGACGSGSGSGSTGGGGGGGCPSGTVQLPCAPVCIPLRPTVTFAEMTSCAAANGASIPLAYDSGAHTFSGSGTVGPVTLTATLECVDGYGLVLYLESASGRIGIVFGAPGSMPLVAVNVNLGSLGVCAGTVRITVS